MHGMIMLHITTVHDTRQRMNVSSKKSQIARRFSDIITMTR